MIMDMNVDCCDRMKVKTTPRSRILDIMRRPIRPITQREFLERPVLSSISYSSPHRPIHGSVSGRRIRIEGKGQSSERGIMTS